MNADHTDRADQLACHLPPSVTISAISGEVFQIAVIAWVGYPWDRPGRNRVSPLDLGMGMEEGRGVPEIADIAVIARDRRDRKKPQ